MTDNYITLVCIPVDIARRAAAALSRDSVHFMEAAHNYRRNGDAPSAALMDTQAKKCAADAEKILQGVK